MGLFVGASLLFLTVWMLNSYHDKENENFDDMSDSERRLSISISYLNVLETILWFLCHCLMLFIFKKYGKPLESNEKKLIQMKLTEVF